MRERDFRKMGYVAIGLTQNIAPPRTQKTDGFLAYSDKEGRAQRVLDSACS